MTWSPVIYASFADQATAETQLAAAGLVAPNSLTSIDATICALVAPITEWSTWPMQTTPGVARPGFWVMLRIDEQWGGYAAAIATLQPYVQQLDRPCNVFAG